LGSLACPAYAQTLANKKQEITSKIERVTTFVSGAQVTRKASATLAAGKTELVFTEISPNIDKQSIQIKGDGAFTILSVIHQMNYLKEQKRQDELLKLEASKKALQARMATERSMLAVYKQEEAMLLKNQAIGGQNTGVKATDLRESLDFQRKRLAEALLKQVEIEQAIQNLDSTTRKIDAQMIALNYTENLATSEVVVTVSAKEFVNAKFEISYLVKDAGWYATYDLRVQDISKPIALTFKANIRQSSGEDWKDVKLSISNGNPTEGGNAPMLTPWNLYYNTAYLANTSNFDRNSIVGKVTDENGEGLLGVAVMVKGSTLGTMTDADGAFKLNVAPNGQILVASYIGFQRKEIAVSSNIANFVMEEDNNTLNEVVVTGYARTRDKRDINKKYKRLEAKKEMEKKPDPNFKAQDEDRRQNLALEVATKFQPTTVVFDIEMPYTILNDGKFYTAEIKDYSLPADYQYYAVPKIDKDAFLKAQITNWRDLNLMDGELNLFFEGAFLGKSVLDLRTASDTLEISLGRDKGIVIERKNLKEYTSKQFLSNYKTESRAYQISVKNNKNQPIKLTLQDHFPISTNKEVTIDNQEAKDAQIDEKTQIITWKLDLPARSEKVQTMKYTVKYPKREIVILD
jgi:hypothetical protein